MKQTELQFYSSQETGEALLNQSVKATSQTVKVWELMKDGKKRTSVEVSDELGMNLNSARRCLTDLMKKFGLIYKLEEMKRERYSALNHYYQKS